MSIYTKTGDAGDTALFGGGRVPKSDRRVAAYGAVDETSSAIGLALAIEPGDLAREALVAVQRDLFAIGAQLAAPDPRKVAKALVKAALDPERVRALERLIDEADRELPELQTFVLPGGTPKAAALHVARTMCRRAERSVVALHAAHPVPDVMLAYLNRLSDVLFTLARLANHRAHTPDTPW